MIFQAKLVEGRLIRRYKRFLADVQLAHAVITAACPNTGSTDAIDPEYGRTLREAIAAGVEVLAYRAKVTPDEIRLERRIPVVRP